MFLPRMLVLLALSAALTGCMLRPKAVPDSAVTFRGAAVDIPVLANDTDPRQRELELVSATASAKGQTRINQDQTIRYIPNSDATGEDVFSYKIQNSRGRSSTAEVTVTILEPQNRPAVAAPPGNRPQPTTEPVAPAVANPQISISAPETADGSRRAQPISTAPAAPSTPPPSTPVPVAPPPPPITPSAAATLNGISVTLFTREDDKDAGETVQVTIRKGETILAQQAVGGAEAWPKHSDRIEEVSLTPPVAGTDASLLTVEVRKIPGLGAGEAWVMQVDVQGRLSDGRTVMLVPRSLPFRYGGGSSNSRTWKCSALPAPTK